MSTFLWTICKALWFQKHPQTLINPDTQTQHHRTSSKHATTRVAERSALTTLASWTPRCVETVINLFNNSHFPITHLTHTYTHTHTHTHTTHTHTQHTHTHNDGQQQQQHRDGGHQGVHRTCQHRARGSDLARRPRASGRHSQWRWCLLSDCEFCAMWVCVVCCVCVCVCLS